MAVYEFYSFRLLPGARVYSLQSVRQMPIISKRKFCVFLDVISAIM